MLSALEAGDWRILVLPVRQNHSLDRGGIIPHRPQPLILLKMFQNGPHGKSTLQGLQTAERAFLRTFPYQVGVKKYIGDRFVC